MRWWTGALPLVIACAASPRPGPGGPAGGGSPPPSAPPPSASSDAPPPAAGVAVDTIGTAHPIVLEATADDGSWLVICQARADTDGDGEIAVHAGHHGDTYGDRFAPFVVGRDGREQAIDAVVTRSDDGRWLVVVRGGKLALHDAAAGTWLELPGAEAKDDGVPVLRHRAASVDADGTRLVYFRGGDRVVVRDLATGAEREVTQPGIWRAEVDRDGRWARLLVVRKDQDGDGKVTWPSLRTSLSDRDCRGPIMSYSTGGWSGDMPEFLWLDLATGAIVDEGEAIVAPVGADLLRAGPRGALSLAGRELASAACDPQVVGVAAAPPRVLYTCRPSHGDEAAVTLAGPGLARPTTMTATRRADWRDELARFRGPVACNHGTCVDLDAGAARPDPTSGHEVIASHGTRRLIAGTPLAIVDVADGSRVEVGAGGGELQAAAGPVVVVAGVVYDLAARTRLGAVRGVVRAVDRAGRALVLDGDDGGIPRGPLRWVTPSP